MTEIPNQWVDDNIDGIKIAVTFTKQRDLHWMSSDGLYVYQAKCPLDLEIDAVDFGNMPAWKTLDILNGWILRRLSTERTINNELETTQYLLAPQEPVNVLRWLTPISLFDSRVDDPLAKIEGDRNFKAAVDHQEYADMYDHADIDNAVFDLNKIAWDQIRVEAKRRANMTPEEKFHERELKREWVAEPPRNDTGNPVWWSVSTTSTLFTVYAMSAEEALQNVEDKYNGGEQLMIYWVNIQKDETQQELALYQEQKVLRLIPFSNVPWADDPNNMTDKQKAAWHRLKRD